MTKIHHRVTFTRHYWENVVSHFSYFPFIHLFCPSFCQAYGLSLSPSALFVQWSLCTSLPLSEIMFSNGGKLKQGSHACRTLTLPPAGLLVCSMHTDEGTWFLAFVRLHTSERNQLALHSHMHEIYMQNRGGETT